MKPLFPLKACLCVLACLSASVYSIASDSSSDTSNTAQSAEVPKPPSLSATMGSPGTVNVPGPLRSFLRMAGISQKISAEEVLPLLARNVAVEGYQGRKDKTGQAHGVSDSVEALCRSGEGVGHAGQPNRRDSSFWLRPGGPTSGDPGLPAEARMRKRRVAGNRRCGKSVSDHRFRVSFGRA